MNREPIGLYVIRLLTGFMLFFFMCMLYWSSTLIEHDMKGLVQKLEKLESQILDFKTGMATRPSVSSTTAIAKDTISSTRPHIDPSLPNL